METAQNTDDLHYKQIINYHKEKEKAFSKLYQIIRYSEFQDKITTEQAIKILFFYPHLSIDKIEYHCYTDTHFGRGYIKSTINVYIGDFVESFSHCICLDSNCIEDALMLPKIAKEMCDNIGITNESFDAINSVKRFYEEEVKNEIKIKSNEIQNLKEKLLEASELNKPKNIISYYTSSQREYKKQKCYIMIDASTNYVKIGKSQNPGHRERTLQAEKPTIKMIHVFEDDIEKELHSKFNDRRLRGEWFDLSENEVNELIELYS